MQKEAQGSNRASHGLENKKIMNKYSLKAHRANMRTGHKTAKGLIFQWQVSTMGLQ